MAGWCGSQEFYQRRLKIKSKFYNTANESTSNDLVVIYQNVRGLRTKIRDISANILCENFPVYALTETWLTENINSSEIFDNRYIVYRSLLRRRIKAEEVVC